VSGDCLRREKSMRPPAQSEGGVAALRRWPSRRQPSYPRAVDPIETLHLDPPKAGIDVRKPTGLACYGCFIRGLFLYRLFHPKERRLAWLGRCAGVAKARATDPPRPWSQALRHRRQPVRD
jgi:hypothetical protein